MSQSSQTPPTSRQLWLLLATGLFFIVGCLLVIAFIMLNRQMQLNRALLDELIAMQSAQETAVATTPATAQRATPTAAVQPATLIPLPTPSMTPSPTDIAEPIRPKETAENELERSENFTVRDNFYTLEEDEPLTTTAVTGVLANDDFVANNRLSPTLATQPIQGSLTLLEDGSFTYQPAPNYFGEDFFTYVACSADNECANGTVQLVINPVNDPPEADPESLFFFEDDPIQELTQLLLMGDQDIEANPFFIIDVETDAPERVLFDLENGRVQYDMQDDFNSLGADEIEKDIFQYIIADSKGATTSATVTITIQGLNDPPVAGPDTIFVSDTVDTTVPISTLLENDQDPDMVDQNQLRINELLNNSEGGTATLAGDFVTYAPDEVYLSLSEGMTTTDVLTYTIVDLQGVISEQVEVNVVVEGRNQAPELGIPGLAQSVIFSSTVTNTMSLVNTAVITDSDSTNFAQLQVQFADAAQPDAPLEFFQMQFDGEIITSTGAIALPATGLISETAVLNAIHSLQYVNQSLTPTSGCRQMTVQLTDDFNASSNTVTISVAVNGGLCPSQTTSIIKRMAHSLQFTANNEKET